MNDPKQNNRNALPRRDFVKTAGLAGAASVAFGSLSARRAKAMGFFPRMADYGPLSPKADMATGLELLSLPEGFEYMSFGWTGQIMGDGRPTPTDHDGMAVVARRGKLLSLVRNHELSAGEGSQCLVEGAMYNPDEFGGTTTLHFDLRQGKFVDSYTSLGGTIRNCAGGLTPWASWVSCEETFGTWTESGFNHGYVFDVPGFGIATGEPVRAAGRFSHEACAVDPRTGVLYETEDTGASGFYKYVQPGAGGRSWRGGRARGELLRDGGELYAMVIDGEPRKDLRVGFEDGATFRVRWELVEDPEGVQGRAYDSAPNAAMIARGEGCWYDSGILYFVSTSGGEAGLGQVWGYDPASETLTMVYESRDADAVDGPDNLAVSPRGGILLCEDGDSNPKRMVGLTQRGETFTFAENQIVLGAGDIDVIDAAFPGARANFWDPVEGDYRSREWAGATFYGDWLFANVQSPGVTFAIRGPWWKGGL